MKRLPGTASIIYIRIRSSACFMSPFDERAQKSYGEWTRPEGRSSLSGGLLPRRTSTAIRSRRARRTFPPTGRDARVRHRIRKGSSRGRSRRGARTVPEGRVLSCAKTRYNTISLTREPLRSAGVRGRIETRRRRAGGDTRLTPRMYTHSDPIFVLTIINVHSRNEYYVF